MQNVYSYQQLFSFSKNIFLKIGCTEANAATAAKVLLSADLRGVDSHGIARLSGYIRLWEVNRITANKHIFAPCKMYILTNNFFLSLKIFFCKSDAAKPMQKPLLKYCFQQIFAEWIAMALPGYPAM